MNKTQIGENAGIVWNILKIDFDMNQEGDRIFLTVNVFIG